MAKREFTISGEYVYDRSGPVRWVASHLLRYKLFILTFLLPTAITNILADFISILIGNAFNTVLQARNRADLLHISFTLLAMVLVIGVFDLAARLSSEVLGKRVARDTRDELYLNLLGKSQTFHNRQRVGDIMARAANDVGQISDMIVPALDIIIDSSMSLVIPIIFIGFLQVQLLLTPLIFTAVYVVALRAYVRRLTPVADRMREQFGLLNAGLAETTRGIDVVKSSAQEAHEQRKFEEHARRYRDFFVENGRIQARYLPMLLLTVALVGAFFHGLLLVSRQQLSVGGLVSYMGLMGVLRFPVSLSVWTFSLVGLGLAAARRILAVLREETDLDEQADGYAGLMRGEIVFEGVTAGYGEAAALQQISFRAAPGQIVAIVGQTGSGKSTLTRLVNRIYDVQSGSVRIDGVDVREWSLAALRSQISTIEQDVFLFSRTIAENIAFGLGQQVDHAAIEQAARDAQAHEFIMGFKDGYATVIGERGITLSGGQRQRLAIARALLTDPRILIMDDATSAIDSATEDEIQQAMRRLLRGRTTLLITHRLSQIRAADTILVLQGGRLVDHGSHGELLGRCALYRRIFAHTDLEEHKPLATTSAVPGHF